MYRTCIAVYLKSKLTVNVFNVRYHIQNQDIFSSFLEKKIETNSKYRDKEVAVRSHTMRRGSCFHLS